MDTIFSCSLAYASRALAVFLDSHALPASLSLPERGSLACVYALPA